MGSREREPNKRIYNSYSEILPRPELPCPPLVILASESQRRTLAAKYLFPSSHVINMCGGEEAQTDDLVYIANRKLDHVMPQARPAIMGTEEKRGIIIGTDVKVSTFGLYEEPGIKDKGKPKSALEVRGIFRDMYRAAFVTEQDPYYLIRSASAIVDFSQKPERKSYSPNFTQVTLDQDRIGYLSTNEGFNEYSRELEEFFSGQSYLNNGLRMPATITDITGGLDLPVLARLGAVKSISINTSRDIPTDDVDFADQLKQGIFNSTVGFIPHMLKPYEPQVDELIAGWSWLEQVSNYALGQNTASLLA